MRRRKCEINTFETKYDYEIEVNKLTDTLCKCLKDDIKKQNTPRHSHIRSREVHREEVLERIESPDAFYACPTPVKERESDRRVGIAVI